MKLQEFKNTAEWLESDPPLGELSDRFPELWERVQRDLARELTLQRPDAVKAYLLHLEKKARQSSLKGMERITAAAMYQMARKGIKQHFVAVASGVEQGKVRFNRYNAFIAQKLLFSDGLTRKPVSLFWFNLMWRFVSQKRFLMPLVQPEGIYCFYSKEFIASLTVMLGKMKCLEIAAGDGTLSRFLSTAGVNITATDDFSWQHAITYPTDVKKMEAADALSRFAPEAVICSWPPAMNRFEKQIFLTKSVQLYVMIGSRHQFAAGNFTTYKEQELFDCEEEKKLGRMILPPELDPAVYVFRRK